MTSLTQRCDEYGLHQKAKAALLILPLLGIFGGLAHAFEVSESATTSSMVILLMVSFLVTVFRARRAERDEALLAAELEMWRERDTRLKEYFETNLVAQRALVELLRRQQAEADELERQNKELAKQRRKLAKQHKKEYEELINRRYIA